MKYARHPITNEVKPCSPLEYKRLLRFGWLTSTAAEHWQYHREVTKAIVERMPKKGESHRRLQ